MSQFLGGGEHDDSSLLDYEATLKALLSLIGRQVLGSSRAPAPRRSSPASSPAASTAASWTNAYRSCSFAPTHQRCKANSAKPCGANNQLTEPLATMRPPHTERATRSPMNRSAAGRRELAAPAAGQAAAASL
jgi:hypothetical protein